MTEKTDLCSLLTATGHQLLPTDMVHNISKVALSFYNNVNSTRKFNHNYSQKLEKSNC